MGVPQSIGNEVPSVLRSCEDDVYHNRTTRTELHPEIPNEGASHTTL